ncbi:MAG: prepilin-type N-terminal cleavage/methylation domain-containing protein [Aquipseudomonas alcaligenes]|uniref:Prepilin-type N-terminal cleavage/methylation domain-containing protein n=1 Tax=Aquipseudomonas alcaligenes TaxID=43263 RepID=A0A5C7WGA1_AQUAC|nr:MAG: prepilin-type N-terminal cleavage/methylation domain-containing protein [Pseudomonas alcaligenes]
MNAQKGFTLIEVLITAIILAILAAIAIPSYTQYVERAECEDGKALITGAANFMERYRAQNGGSYTNASLATFGSSSEKFAVEITNAAAATYTLTATAQGNLSGSLTLTQANVRAGSLANQCNW